MAGWRAPHLLWTYSITILTIPKPSKQTSKIRLVWLVLIGSWRSGCKCHVFPAVSGLHDVICVWFISACLLIWSGLNVDDLTQRTLKFFGPGSEYDTPVNDPYREKGGRNTSHPFMPRLKNESPHILLAKLEYVYLYLWCVHQGRDLSCPLRDHGDTQAWKASWRMWMQGKRRLVNLLSVHHSTDAATGSFANSCVCICYRLRERLSDRWDHQTGSYSGFLCRKAWHAGKGWAGRSCHPEQWCMCGRDFGSCKVSVYSVLGAPETTNMHLEARRELKRTEYYFSGSWSISSWMVLIQKHWTLCWISSMIPTESSRRIWTKQSLVCEADCIVASLH